MLLRHKQIMQARIHLDRCGQARQLPQIPRVENEQPAPLLRDLIRRYQQNAFVLGGAIARVRHHLRLARAVAMECPRHDLAARRVHLDDVIRREGVVARSPHT